MATRTAAERRAEAKAEYDAFFAQCPSRQLLERISDKWVALVLAALGGDGPGTNPGDEPMPMRFSELQRRISGVSQKMLTQTLRALERDGMVTRTVTPTVPVTVSYELTGLGRSLQGLMKGIKAWAEGHMEEVLTHRGGFDQGQGAAAD
ncbi:winged helix-turn-helix transcriptional regulator [Streptomyces sp. NBC_01264]|uniref:winged helix-turn-helix transcriptional regulator n=1 Tax=Streptomyces sp. NBC_01264 TaxID=2903804 RepID=UPI00224F5DE2|nr:helix-turn-helix domain-containing protein [Streptomyces sp. NBC_01264]MCX4780721.1 helix-turn-helix transcriptional regulator [Streptomyces sp. NBC_01264]